MKSRIFVCELQTLLGNEPSGFAGLGDFFHGVGRKNPFINMAAKLKI